MNELQDQMDHRETSSPPRISESGTDSMQFLGNFRRRRRLYRSRGGMIFGVCKGLANYAELPVFWIRIILIGLTILSWVLPFVILYVVAAFLMRPEPSLEPAAEEDWRSYTENACAQSLALARLKRELDEIELRILRLERRGSARQFDWECRLNKGR